MPMLADAVLLLASSSSPSRHPTLFTPNASYNFFLKYSMDVAASSLQILQASAILPMVAKPLLARLSDVIPIRGYQRLPYVAIGGSEGRRGGRWSRSHWWFSRSMTMRNRIVLQVVHCFLGFFHSSICLTFHVVSIWALPMALIWGSADGKKEVKEKVQEKVVIVGKK